MYNTHPNSGLHFEKRCQMPKTEEVIHKTGIKKSCFFMDTLKKDNSIISLEMPLL